MPAKSEKQRKMFAVAEHAPGKLYKKNKSVLKMSRKKLHEFASDVEDDSGHSLMKKYMKKKME